MFLCIILTNFYFNFIAEPFEERLKKCGDLTETASVMEEKIGKFRMPVCMPTTWLCQYEALVQEYFQVPEIEYRLFSLLPFFLEEDHSTWYFEQRRLAKKTWVNFREDFINYFLKLFWRSMKHALASEHQTSDSVHDFAQKKIADTQALFPELTPSSVLKMCCSFLSEDLALEMHEAIDMGINMFLTRLKVIDKRAGTVSEMENKGTYGIKTEPNALEDKLSAKLEEKMKELNNNQVSTFENLFSKSMQGVFKSTDFQENMKKLFQNSIPIVAKDMPSSQVSGPNGSNYTHTPSKMNNDGYSFNG